MVGTKSDSAPPSSAVSPHLVVNSIVADTPKRSLHAFTAAEVHIRVIAVKCSLEVKDCLKGVQPSPQTSTVDGSSNRQNWYRSYQPQETFMHLLDNDGDITGIQIGWRGDDVKL